MLELHNVGVSIGKKRVLKDVSFSLPGEALTVLVGKNGSGKTTLLSAVNGERAHTGEILLDGAALACLSARERAKRIAFLPQYLRTPAISLEELVFMGRNPYLELGRRPSPEDAESVEEAIASMGLQELRERRVDLLSGGERQKAYLAMILAQKTPLLMLDEPTTYMDPSFTHTMLGHLKCLCKREKKTILVVMHDLNSAIRYADHLAVLEEGGLSFFGTREECLQKGVIEAAFSVRRFEADGRIFFEGTDEEK